MDHLILDIPFGIDLFLEGGLDAVCIGEGSRKTLLLLL